MSRNHHHHSTIGNLAPLGSVFEAAVEPLRAVLQAIARWRPLRRLDAMVRIAKARRDLRELDDRMLRDIGVTRLDVDRESRRRFWDVEERTEE